MMKLTGNRQHQAKSRRENLALRARRKCRNANSNATSEATPRRGKSGPPTVGRSGPLSGVPTRTFVLVLNSFQFGFTQSSGAENSPALSTGMQRGEDSLVDDHGGP